MSDLNKSVLELLRVQKDRVEQMLRKINAAEQLALLDADQIRYELTLRSCWSGYGEKDVTIKGKDVVSLIARATKKFKQINNRSDVQADCSLMLVINDYSMYIPDEMWQHLRK